MFRHRQATTRSSDPRELLDYFYQTQIEELTMVRRTVSDRATHRKRLELQLGVAEQNRAKLARQAEDLAHNPDLREQVLNRIASTEKNIAALQRQHDAAQELVQESTADSWRRQEILDSFRTHKGGFNAEYGGLAAGTRAAPGQQKSVSAQITDDAAVKMAAITDLLVPDWPDTAATQSPDAGEN